MKNVKRIAAVLLTAIVILTCFTACSSPKKDILGAWRDSTGMAGYEFLEDGVCKVTVLDVAIIDGTINGTYTIAKKDDGNYYVTVSYTLLYTSVIDEFMFAVDGNVLTLTKVNKDGTFASPVIYTAYTADVTTAAQ